MNEEIFKELSERYLEGVKSDYLPEILEMCLSEDEVKLLLNLPGSLQEISERSGLDIDQASEKLEQLFSAGFIVKKRTDDVDYYALLNDLLVFMLHDKRIFNRIGGDHTKKEFLDLWDKLFENELSKLKTHGERYIPEVRVIPIERTIPMSWGEVLPLEKISIILENARSIALSECACRVMGRKCDNPTDVCILLDDFADIIVARGAAERITKERALEVLDECESKGLIHHLSNTSPEGYSFICNCCSCCCMILRGMIQLGRGSVCHKSRYLSRIAPEKCTGCGICVERCVFSALQLVDSLAKVNEDKCFGCGLCASICPESAIRMECIRGAEHIVNNLGETPEDTIEDLMIK